MKINVIAATVVCRIGFSTPGGALHAEFGESLAGRFRHKLLRKRFAELRSWLTMSWNSFTSVGQLSIFTASISPPKNPH